MKTTRLKLICITILLISSSKFTFSQECSEKQIIEIDTAVKMYIEDNFPNSRIADTSDYIDDWCMFYKGKDVPYYAKSDFNGDGINDYAILLFSDIETKMIVINGTRNGNFTRFDLRSVNSESLDDLVSPPKLEIGFLVSPPGEIYDFETESTYNIKTNYLTIYCFERWAFSYYWKNNNYIEIHSAD